MKSKLLLILVLLQACASTQRVAVLSNSALAGLDNLHDINYTFRDHCVTTHELKNYKAIQDKDKIDLGSARCAEWNRIDSAKNTLLGVVTSYFSGLKKLSGDESATVYLPPLTKYLRTGSYLNINMGDEQVTAINTISDKLISAALNGYRNQEIKNFITGSDASLSKILSKLEEFTVLLRTTIKSDKALLLDAYTPLIKSGSNQFQQIQAFKEYAKQESELDKKERQLTAFITTLRTISKAHNEVASKVNTLSKKEWQQLIIQQSTEIYSLIREFKDL